MTRWSTLARLPGTARSCKTTQRDLGSRSTSAAVASSPRLRWPNEPGQSAAKPRHRWRQHRRRGPTKAKVGWRALSHRPLVPPRRRRQRPKQPPAARRVRTVVAGHDVPASRWRAPTDRQPTLPEPAYSTRGTGRTARAGRCAVTGRTALIGHTGGTGTDVPGGPPDLRRGKTAGTSRASRAKGGGRGTHPWSHRAVTAKTSPAEPVRLNLAG